jgi:polysaccharide export outer membrane protein
VIILNIKHVFYTFLSLIFLLGSCKTYQNSMFQDINTKKMSRAIDELNNDYLIQPGDEISIKLYTRQGAQLIEAVRTNVTNSQEAGQQASQSTYIVSNEGILKLPILGAIVVNNHTESRLKELLEKRFESNYIQPFVQLRVENRRVFLFKGNTASVIQLNRTPTSIFEVIAKSGGLERHHSSAEILIIRGDLKQPTIYKANLQTFQGIQNSEIYLQSKDIVYIPEKQRKLYNSMQDITPIITTPLAILSGILSTIVLLVTITK